MHPKFSLLEPTSLSRLPDRSRVTLITVFPYPDGTVIAADSQETVKDMRGNEFKYSVLKLKPEKMGNFQVAITGGGNGEAIDAFIEDCKQTFSGTTLDNLGDFKKAIQAKLKECRKDLRSVGDDNKMHLLIAAQIGHDYAVWKARSHVLTDVTEPDLIGFTDYMYQQTVKEFQPNTLPVIQLILLSLRVLDFARQTSNCVGEPYSVVIVRKDGIHVFDAEIIKQFMQSLDIFGAAVNRLLLACGDTTLRSGEFDKQLGEFSVTARHLRDEYLQAVGHRAFSGILFESDKFFSYMGSIPVIPPLSMISLVLQKKSGEPQIQVREQTAEETERWKQMRELALKPSPNLVDVADIRMMQCNPPCNRQFAGKLVRKELDRTVLSGQCPTCQKEYNLELKKEPESR
ncbi:MAG: hypothetical protein ABSE82_16625 [Nitrososphaerales archaeon]|jgi:hypothetical protein